MARSAARLKLGYYPLVESEALRIRQFLRFPEACAALDPCAGTGRALQLIAGSTGARLYGIELDAFRAQDAAKALDRVVQGTASSGARRYRCRIARPQSLDCHLQCHHHAAAGITTPVCAWNLFLRSADSGRTRTDLEDLSSEVRRQRPVAHR